MSIKIKSELASYKSLWDDFEGNIGDEKSEFKVFKNGKLIKYIKVDTSEIDELCKQIGESQAKELGDCVLFVMLDKENVTHNAVALLIGRKMNKVPTEGN